MAEYLTKEEYEKDAYDKRHDFVNKKFQPTINKLDEKMDTQNSQVITLGKDMEYIKKEFTEHKLETKEGFQEIKDLIKEQNGTYATKQEHKINSNKINALFKIWIFIGSIVGAAFIGAIINLIMIKG